MGLDLVERLSADLGLYTSRRGGGRRLERLQKEVLEHQAAVEEADARVDRLRADMEVLDDEQAGLETALEQQERRLAAEGGSYASRRPMLRERLAVVQAEIETASGALRDLSSELLPFALVPGLWRTLANKLTREAKLYRRKIADELWQERVFDVEAALRGEDMWEGLNLPSDVRRALVRRVIQAFRETSPPVETGPFVHRLAEPEHDRLLAWISEALHSVPRRVHSLGERLSELRTEQHRLEEDLRRAPEEEALAPVHAEITDLQANLSEARQRRATLGERLGALRYQRDEQARQLQRTAEQLAEAQAGEKQLVLAQRGKLVLRTYQDALTRQRLAALEEALVESWGAVCHKEHLLASATIEPEDFAVRLQGTSGDTLSPSDFSAGERQLYVLALLWALRRVSGRQLPLAVDTPIAP